jgi:gamma-glutamyltranspeptidase / glutathione hydrolase
MKRRTFLAALPFAAVSGAAAAQVAPHNIERPDMHSGERQNGVSFASRSTVWGANGAAATGHPMATMIAIETLKKGGSAVDAAIAANAALGFLEPTANGIGGDAFCLLWDPKQKKVMGLNGSGHSPAALTLDVVRSRAVDGNIPGLGAVAVSVPGAVDAWWTLHQRYGKLPWKDLLEPAAALAEAGTPVPQAISMLMGRGMKRFLSPGAGIEETENIKKLYLTRGRPPMEGEIFRNPDLARTLRMIGKGGRDAYYDGPIADTIEAYFKRIGGWMTRKDLKAHHSQWVDPLSVDYRKGVSVYGMPPNSQGPSTLQMLSILKNFDLRDMGLMSPASVHHQAEAKRLAFEDRARYYADPDFAEIPIAHLLSDSYGQQRAGLINPNRVMDRVFPGDAPYKGGTTYLTTSDSSGMMVSLIQSNFAGMGSGLMPDGLGFIFHNRGDGFSLVDGSPNIYAPGKRPFNTIIPGFALKDGAPWLSFGVMGGGMQPQGQTQIIVNLLEYDLDLQSAGDCPRWRHDGSSEPTGRPAPGVGTLSLESGAPAYTRTRLAEMGWKLSPTTQFDSGYGGYQAIMKGAEAYAAATEMRKDGLALGY